MSQTNTHTNNGQNRYQNTERSGQVQDPNSSSGLGNCRNDCGNKLTAKYSFKGKMKDSPISKLTITETGHRTSQFKKLWDALSVLCADKSYGGHQVRGDFMPPNPNITLWFHTHQIQITTVADRAALVVGSAG